MSPLTRRANSWPRVLLPRGFLDCTNAEYALVSVETGDLEARFVLGSGTKPPVQSFQLWDATTGHLSPAPATYAASWHPHSCLKPAPEDLRLGDLADSHRPIRYLQPEHGTIEWSRLDADGHPEGPTLHCKANFFSGAAKFFRFSFRDLGGHNPARAEVRREPASGRPRCPKAGLRKAG